MGAGGSRFRIRRSLVAAALTVVAVSAGISGVQATHSWNGFHWARSSNPFTLRLGDNVDPTWDGHLGTASADWRASSVLNTRVVTGKASGRNCRPDAGRIEVCNASYGNNGWLGIAVIWLSGRHITKGSVRVNDFYFDRAPYDDPDARQHVICQEIGHVLGLDHQVSPTSRSCMDDENGLFDPAFAHPNRHDYEQLETIYRHLDGGSGVASAPEARVTTRPSAGGLVVTFVFPI